jgi:hypothetical protein
VYFGGPLNGKVGIFYGHLVHFTPNRYTLLPFGIPNLQSLVYFLTFWYFAPRKSGNPADKKEFNKHFRAAPNPRVRLPAAQSSASRPGPVASTGASSGGRKMSKNLKSYARRSMPVIECGGGKTIIGKGGGGEELGAAESALTTKRTLVPLCFHKGRELL